jgi:formylglycine-generating enzyme required for sulfatase activity
MKISDMLAVGRFKVTYAEWEACVVAGGCRRRSDDSGWGRGRQPVININWADAQQYAAWLSRRTKKTYRLLTGSEWEYAARTGSDVYDMHENVPEWVADCYQYRDERSDGKVWTLDCTTQMVRGAGWNGPANSARSAPRPAPLNENRIGFRIARSG